MGVVPSYAHSVLALFRTSCTSPTDTHSYPKERKYGHAVQWLQSYLVYRVRAHAPARPRIPSVIGTLFILRVLRGEGMGV